MQDYFYGKHQTTEHLSPNVSLDMLMYQQQLNAHGFSDMFGKPLATDGILGPNTQWAMDMAFKESNMEPRSSIWSIVNDDEGLQIVLHYLFGEGHDVIIDEDWGDYMMSNKNITENVKDILFHLGDELGKNEEKEINIVFPMEIENGEDIIAYQYLHGTNADAGGFQIWGTISKDELGDVTYNLTYAWNDIMDPNFTYKSDEMKAALAKLIPFADPEEYAIHIYWSDISVVPASPAARFGSGWLS